MYTGVSPEEPKEPIKEPKIFNIDINKCRKNILFYGDCVFTVFDKVKRYRQQDNL
jgi:hypothetical protein